MADQNITERLDRMQREINAWQSSVQRRKATGSLLMVLFVVIMAGYLYFLYTKVATIQANEVVLMVEQPLQQYIEFPEAELTKALESKAQPTMKQASEALLKLPAQIEARAYGRINAELDAQIPQLEKQLEEQFNKALMDAREKAIAAGKKVDDPATIKQIVAEMAELVIAEMNKTLDNFYADYTKQSSDIVNYLDMLAQNDKLEPKAAMHRELLIHFFALVQKYKVEGTPNLIGGTKSQI